VNRAESVAFSLIAMRAAFFVGDGVFGGEGGGQRM
jgi:hypothetical protein